MGYRPLTEQEKTECETKIKETKEQIAIRENYVTFLEARIKDGEWESDISKS